MTLPAPTLEYWVVDVFTDQAFAGNPLAVVLGADALTTEQMQAIAREFNLSETTFPIDTSKPGADYRLRIFTPTHELPFAGHPSVGSAWVLQSIGRVAAGRVVQDCLAGLLPLEIGSDVTLTGGTPTLGEAVDPAALCAATGLDAADAVDSDSRWAGCGLQWAYVRVRDEAVARARPDLARLTALSESGPDRAGVAVLSWTNGLAHARVFAGGFGVPEDPATGSAALGLGVWLVATGLAPGDGTTSYDIEQGAEMHRPSRLSCVVRAEGGRAVECQVRGTVQPVANGHIAIP
jgi:trans-2,3-dihydro-3-hydroxyanthranilate isomerase